LTRTASASASWDKGGWHRHILRVTLVILTIGLVGENDRLTSVSSQGQKEVRTQQRHADGGYGEIGSLSELVKLSDAIVIGVVTSSRSSSLAPSGLPDEAGTFLSTAYSVSIKDLLVWPDPAPGPAQVIDVEVAGVGDHDRGTHILRLATDRYRPLTVGSSYILFLRQYRLGPKDGSRVAWIPATGDGQSILQVRGPLTAPQAATRLALKLAALSPIEIAREVKLLRKGGRQ